MKPLRTLVVGAGSGGRLSIRALTESPMFELAGVADMNPAVCEAVRAEYPGIAVETDYLTLFHRAEADVVCVSTWAPSHEEVTLAALELPLIGILVEKPLGHTYASGTRILAAVGAKGIPMAVPHGLLARRTPDEIAERVRNGEIGELRLVEIENSGWDIINAGIHWLNYFVRLTGNEPILWVMAACESSTRTYRDGMQVETTGVTYAQTRSGVRVVMNTGDEVLVSREGKSILFRIVGTSGLIEFWGWENGYRIVDAAHPGGELVVPEEYAVTGHRRHLEAMGAMAESGEPEWTVPESSLAALEMVEAAYLSSRTGTKVVFPLESFVPPHAGDWDPGAPYAGAGGGRDGRKL